MHSGDRHPWRENYDKIISRILEEGFGLLLGGGEGGGTGTGGKPKKEEQQTTDAWSPRLCLLHIQTLIFLLISSHTKF